MVVGLEVDIKGNPKDLNAALDETKGKVGGLGGALGGIAGSASSFIPVAAAAAGVAVALVGMTKAASEDAAEQARLEAAIKASGAATGDWQAQVESAITAGQDKAFSDTQTRDALQSLVTTTGDLTEAQTLLATAQDIARFANVDLAVAADAVAKANEGQDGALRKLLPGIEKGATATDTLANATKAAAGQADTFAKSSEGSMARAADGFGELGETVGAALLPILDELIPVLIPIVKQLSTLITSILPLLTPAIKLLGFAFKIVATQIGIVVTIITTLVGWLKQALDWIGKLIDGIGPLKAAGDFIGGIVGGLSTPAAAAASGRGAAMPAGHSSGGGATSVTINVTTTGDSLAAEQAVMRALRRSTRINAGAAPAWAGGG
jgi:hypothetical protein